VWNRARVFITILNNGKEISRSMEYSHTGKQPLVPAVGLLRATSLAKIVKDGFPANAAT